MRSWSFSIACGPTSSGTTSRTPSESIMAATVAMAPRADGAALRKRILSAAILLPLAIVDLWLGAAYWDALVCLFGMIMAWEWARMCAVGDPPAHRPLFRGWPGRGLSVLAAASSGLLAGG